MTENKMMIETHCQWKEKQENKMMTETHRQRKEKQENQIHDILKLSSLILILYSEYFVGLVQKYLHMP